MPSICVIGAGVIGLSSALHVLDRCPGSDVVVVADKFSPFTTTDVSAGFWGPNPLGDTPTKLIRQWSGETLKHMLRLTNSESAKSVGACLVSGYKLSSADVTEPPDWKDQVQNFRLLTKDEATQFPDMKSGIFYTTVMLEPSSYLQWLTGRFQKRGGRFRKMHINSLEELSEAGYDVIVNCTGLGSRDLVKDSSLYPVKGQLIKVKAPWLKMFYGFVQADGFHSYILPGMSYVVLGGTKHTDEWNTNVDQADKLKIWSNCVKYIPSLTEATIESDIVGLRPARPSVRLELETLSNKDGKTLRVIHNYGHGGSGITLHWGCAEHAARLVVQALELSKGRTSKL